MRPAALACQKAAWDLAVRPVLFECGSLSVFLRPAAFRFEREDESIRGVNKAFMAVKFCFRRNIFNV
jgi:hypothetical protein